MDRCLQASSLQDFVSTRLTTSERIAFERHLQSCAGCKQAVAALLQELPKTVSLDGHASGERVVPRATVPNVEGYELLRIVGSGGMGVVYEARKLDTGVRVALKTVSTTTQTAAAALRREASVLRGLAHPGIVSLLDEGDAHGQPYFVMKLVRGRRLSELLGSAPTLSVLRRLCSTLAVLHGQGIVHRDVNPRNILVRGDDQPVLVDFGLAARFAVSESRERIDVAGVTMGTLAYTAPEQLRGELVDPRADLYAVGCILYEVLTGRLPFQQSGPSAQMTAHLHEQPVPPSQIADVPPELDELTLGLLAKHPRQRIGYARDVADVLAKFGARDWAHNRRARPQHYLYRSELMGRKRWLAEAQGKLDLCITGRGERIFIAGDSGAGKTRFLSEIATLAVRMGISVVTAECAAMSGDTNSLRNGSLQALRPLLREVADRCREEPELIGPLLAGRAALLAQYEPALRGLDSEPEPPPLTQAASRARLLACLRDTLVALAQKKPLLLLFDDLQWMDRLSFELISSLSLSLLAQTRVLLVGAYRAELAAPRLTAAPHTTHWQLGRLATDAITAMVRDMLAVDPLPPLLRETVVARASGSPLFAAEYLRLAIANGQLVRSGAAGWTFYPEHELPRSPATIEEIIALRLDILTASAQPVVEVASVLGRSFLIVELITACEGSRERVLLAIEELTYAQVLEAEGSHSLRFVHDKLPETIYARLPAAKRRELHAIAVRTLEASHSGGEVSERYAELAFHWQQAGQPEQAAQYWARAGEQSLKAMAYFDAVQHYEAALRNALDTHFMDDKLLLARWTRGLGEAYYGAGDVEKGEAHLAQSLVGFGLGWPRERAEKRAFLVRELSRQFLPARLGQWLQSGRPVLSTQDRADGALAAERLAFILLWRRDSLATVAGTAMAVNLIDELQADKPTTRPISLLAFMAGLARIRPLERRYFTRARQLSARTPPSDYAYSLFLESYLRAGEGAWSRVEALSGEGLRLLDPQEGLILRDATAILGFVARTRGDYVTARKHAATLRRSAREAGNREHEIWSEVLEGSCWVRALAYERAREHLERARLLLEEAPEWVCQLRSFAQLAHVHFGMERTPQAVALAASGLNVLRQHQGPPLLVSSIDAVMSLAHVHIELWSEQASDASKQALAREALSYLARLALIFPVARAYYFMCLGRYQAVLGRTQRALVLFGLAERSARTLQLPYEQALINWHRAQLQAASVGQRAAWLERARQYFEQLGSDLSASRRAPG